MYRCQPAHIAVHFRGFQHFDGGKKSSWICLLSPFYSQLREIVTAYRINPLQHLLDLGIHFYTPNNNCQLLVLFFSKCLLEVRLFFKNLRPQALLLRDTVIYTPFFQHMPLSLQAFLQGNRKVAFFSTASASAMAHQRLVLFNKQPEGTFLCGKLKPSAP